MSDSTPIGLFRCRASRLVGGGGGGHCCGGPWLGVRSGELTEQHRHQYGAAKKPEEGQPGRPPRQFVVPVDVLQPALIRFAHVFSLFPSPQLTAAQLGVSLNVGWSVSSGSFFQYPFTSRPAFFRYAVMMSERSSAGTSVTAYVTRLPF